MDALILWDDGTRNVVCKNELYLVSTEKIMTKGSRVIETKYDFIYLKRFEGGLANIKVTQLNTAPQKLSNKKLIDLNSLCDGPTPLIRLPEFKLFYKNLPHEDSF